MSRVLAGRYRVGEQIGAGGSAKVHEGVDERLNRPVAIKVLDGRAAADADPSGRERFLREARTAASFTHPHAVTTFDAGEDDGTLFMVMELVQGPSLAGFLAATPGPFPVVDALAIADQVLAALASAHDHGIVHRDVKPANILLTPDGEAKLADFGIARRFDELDAALTGAGLVLGTPRYLAPEQVQGKPTGPATDVYAVGLILFEMLAGEVPLVGDTPAATAVVRQTQPVPDMRELRPEVPRAVVRAVERALARHADTRFPDASAFRDELRRAVGYDGTSVPLPVTARTRAVSVAATTVVGGGTAVMSRPIAVAADTSVSDDLDGPPTRATPVVRRWERYRRPAAVAAAAALFGLATVAVADPGRSDLSELAAGAAVAEEGGPGEEIMPGFSRAGDLWGIVAQLENEPSVVGLAGDPLLEGLRRLLSDDSPEWHRAAAQALLADVAVWVEAGHLHPAVAEEIRRHLDPLAAEPEAIEPIGTVEAPQVDSGPPEHPRERGRPGRGRD